MMITASMVISSNHAAFNKFRENPFWYKPKGSQIYHLYRGDSFGPLSATSSIGNDGSVSAPGFESTRNAEGLVVSITSACGEHPVCTPGASESRTPPITILLGIAPGCVGFSRSISQDQWMTSQWYRDATTRYQTNLFRNPSREERIAKFRETYTDSDFSTQSSFSRDVSLLANHYRSYRNSDLPQQVRPVLCGRCTKSMLGFTSNYVPPTFSYAPTDLEKSPRKRTPAIPMTSAAFLSILLNSRLSFTTRIGKVVININTLGAWDSSIYRSRVLDIESRIQGTAFSREPLPSQVTGLMLPTVDLPLLQACLQHLPLTYHISHRITADSGETYSHRIMKTQRDVSSRLYVVPRDNWFDYTLYNVAADCNIQNPYFHPLHSSVLEIIMGHNLSNLESDQLVHYLSNYISLSSGSSEESIIEIPEVSSPDLPEWMNTAIAAAESTLDSIEDINTLRTILFEIAATSQEEHHAD